MQRTAILLAMLAVQWIVFRAPAPAATLEVGPGKKYTRIEDANAAARDGDVILVYPRTDGANYEKTAVFVRRKNLTFRGMPAKGEHYVKISGKGFDYRGRGSTPRAIFQFNRGTDHCVLEGFELAGAHNQSHNGAGVRINQANHITVRGCDLHDNDMGVMSNGNGTMEAGVNQRIEYCAIHHNGDRRHPGYSHNLYLGGTSVTVSACDVHHSLTGHNVKSRAHHTRVEYCTIHDSANREFDLVDAADTARQESHAVLLGNVIVKAPQCPGNRELIHFGQDGGKPHNGTIYLVHNTIVTPFVSSIISMSTPGTNAHIVGNFVCDGRMLQGNQKIVSTRGGAVEKKVTGGFNWFSGGWTGVGGTRLDPKTNIFRRIDGPLFIGPRKHDYHLTAHAGRLLTPRTTAPKIDLPSVPGAKLPTTGHPPAWQIVFPCGKEKRKNGRPIVLGAIGL